MNYRNIIKKNTLLILIVIFLLILLILAIFNKKIIKTRIHAYVPVMGNEGSKEEKCVKYLPSGCKLENIEYIGKEQGSLWDTGYSIYECNYSCSYFHILKNNFLVL